MPFLVPPKIYHEVVISVLTLVEEKYLIMVLSVYDEIKQ